MAVLSYKFKVQFTILKTFPVMQIDMSFDYMGNAQINLIICQFKGLQMK